MEARTAIDLERISLSDSDDDNGAADVVPELTEAINVDDGHDDDPTKDIVRAPQKRRKIRKLTEEDLMNEEYGLAWLARPTRMKIKGIGHECHDLDRIMRVYEQWGSMIVPAISFKEFLGQLDKLSTKMTVKSYLKDLRDKEYRRFFGIKETVIKFEGQDDDYEEEEQEFATVTATATGTGVELDADSDDDDLLLTAVEAAEKKHIMDSSQQQQEAGNDDESTKKEESQKRKRTVIDSDDDEEQELEL